MTYVNEMLSVYYDAFVFYPVTIFDYAQLQPLIVMLWLFIGFLVIVLLVVFIEKTAWVKPFVALWFMPGTLICYAAAFMPWPMVLVFYLQASHDPEFFCTSIGDLVVNLAINLVLVYLVALIGLLMRRLIKRSFTES